MEEKRQTKDGHIAVFDSGSKKFVRWDTPEKPPSAMTKGLASYMTMMGKEGGYGSNPAGKLFSMVEKPFQKAGEAVTTGIAKTFPKLPPQIPAGVGTGIQMIPQALAAFAPQGPGRLAQAKPPEGLFRQLESASGGMKGSLSEQFKTPSLMFSKGTGAARPLYQQAMKEIPYEQTIFKGLTDHKAIVDKAVQTIEEGGKLEPQEGLIARKSLDKVKKKMSDEAFNYYRTTLDKIAKSNKNIGVADPMHRRGMMAESLRQLMPQNKYGGASAFKMGIIPALTAIGGSLGGPAGAGVMGGLGSATLSPAVQGLLAGGAGAISKTDPRLITAILQYLRSRGSNPQSVQAGTEPTGQ